MCDANENRPRGGSLRAASGRLLHLYPEATPATRAVRGCKHEGMVIYLSSRSCRLPDQSFTVRFLSSLQFRVRAPTLIGNGIIARLLPGRLESSAGQDERGAGR